MMNYSSKTVTAAVCLKKDDNLKSVFVILIIFACLDKL